MTFLEGVFVGGAFVSLLSARHFLRILRHIRRTGPAYQFPNISPPRRVLGITFIFVAILSSVGAIATAPTAFPLYIVVSIVVADTLALSLAMVAVLLSFASSLKQLYPKVWVKLLDFPYLFFGLVGVIRLISSTQYVIKQTYSFDFIAILSITIALAIRLAKAIIEVFFADWQ